MKALLYLIYGIGCYLLFLATYAYFALFVAGAMVPQTIDAPVHGDFATSFLIDLALVAGFGIQHSVMARPAFKKVWTRIVPVPIERSTYLLLSCVALGLLIWQWRPLDMVVWHVSPPAARIAIGCLFVAGWLAVPLVSLMIHHFDLFGVRQVWLHFRGCEYTSLPFRTPQLYAHVRHPLYLGWALAFWAIPTMTLGHLIFAVTLTGYMIAAAFIEERDLVSHFGETYEHYRQRVPMFVPRLTRQDRSQKAPKIAT